MANAGWFHNARMPKRRSAKNCSNQVKLHTFRISSLTLVTLKFALCDRGFPSYARAGSPFASCRYPLPFDKKWTTFFM